MSDTVKNDVTTSGNDEAATKGGSSRTQVIGIITIIAGLILAIAGTVTWFTVQSNLSDENITVSEDSPRWAGDPVDGPLTAYQEAAMIEKHYLEATGGKTYAQLDREDPKREVAMQASFLRASLFTSVVAFGVAALAGGLGILFILIGWALLPARQRAPATT